MYSHADHLATIGNLLNDRLLGFFGKCFDGVDARFHVIQYLADVGTGFELDRDQP